jgi:hypothetical protein
MKGFAHCVLIVLPSILLADCSHQVSETLQSWHGPGFIDDRDRWTGPVVPADSNCGAQTTGLMTLDAREFAFDPFGSITVIHGTVEKDRLEGTDTRAVSGQQAISIRFDGTIKHGAKGPPMIDGMLTSGRCTWTVTLRRQ